MMMVAKMKLWLFSPDSKLTFQYLNNFLAAVALRLNYRHHTCPATSC